MQCDYLVVTGMIDDKRVARVLDWLGLGSEGELERIARHAMLGFTGWKKGKCFAGVSRDRYMFMVTGSTAASRVKSPALEGLEGRSVARLDLQVTIPVTYADTVINFCEPTKVYQATRIINVRDPGVTLYVGSPRSDVRLRIYNKTAESGLRGEHNAELVRFELQLRNARADSAFVAVRSGGAGLHFLMVIKRMIDRSTYQLVEDNVKRFEEELFAPTYEEEEEEDKTLKTKRWLENAVIPAIRRLLLTDKEYVDDLLQRIYNYSGTDNDSATLF